MNNFAMTPQDEDFEFTVVRSALVHLKVARLLYCEPGQSCHTCNIRLTRSKIQRTKKTRVAGRYCAKRNVAGY